MHAYMRGGSEREKVSLSPRIFFSSSTTITREISFFFVSYVHNQTIVPISFRIELMIYFSSDTSNQLFYFSGIHHHHVIEREEKKRKNYRLHTFRQVSDVVLQF